MRSPAWLKRFSIAIGLLGLLHLALSLQAWKLNWKGLALEKSLASLFMYLGTGLWIAGSGLLLGMLGESGLTEARWPGPLARGTASLLLVGGVAAMALMWNDPESWLLFLLAAGARWSAGRPSATAGA
jgi:hypothetical protein